MPTTETRPTRPAASPQDYNRAFVSRGVDLQYQVKRASDGELITADAEKGAAKAAAERLGYIVN